MFFLYVLYYWHDRKPHARERARVTMVTRLCARVARSVLFRIRSRHVGLENPSEPLAVVNWVSKVTRAVLIVSALGNT